MVRANTTNTRDHGFTSDHFAIFRVEDPDAIATLRADLIAVYRPVNSQELFAIERMALAQNSILRAARLEAGLLFCGVNQAVDDEGYFVNNPRPALCRPIDMTEGQNMNHGLADGFLRIARESDSWKLFLRYQAQAERNYRRALEEFERLKSLRAELPSEPLIEAEPASASPQPPDPAPTGQVPPREDPAPARQPQPAAPPDHPQIPVAPIVPIPPSPPEIAPSKLL
jgi:hypothetical protein